MHIAHCTRGTVAALLRLPHALLRAMVAPRSLHLFFAVIASFLFCFWPFPHSIVLQCSIIGAPLFLPLSFPPHPHHQPACSPLCHPTLPCFELALLGLCTHAHVYVCTRALVHLTPLTPPPKRLLFHLGVGVAVVCGWMGCGFERRFEGAAIVGVSAE